MLINRRKQKKATLILIAVLAVQASLAYFLSRNMALASTPSLDYRVFWLRDPVLSRGSYVVFHVSDRYIDSRVIKKIVCLPGEKIEVKERDYFCEGKLLGRAKEYTLRGEPLVRFVFNGPIPDGKYFVMGSHKDSYDSRYYGLVDKGRIVAGARPVI